MKCGALGNILDPDAGPVASLQHCPLGGGGGKGGGGAGGGGDAPNARAPI